MTTPSGARTTAELVPLAERARYLLMFRMAAVVLAIGFEAATPTRLANNFARLAMVSFAYLALGVGSELVRRWSKGAGLALFGAMLITDGFYLAWLTTMTGGNASPLRALVILHLISVALLASFRTGLKLAFWHSLLLVMVMSAEDAGALSEPMAARGLPGSRLEQVIGFIVMFWLVALVTSGFSAVSEREVRRRRYDMEALAGLAEALDQVHTRREVAEVVTEHVTDTFAFPRLALVEAHDGPDPLHAKQGAVLAQHGLDARPEDLDFTDSSIVTRALGGRRALLIARLDPTADPDLAALFAGCQNLLIVPLAAEGGAVGVLVAEHGLRAGSRIERRVVETVERFAGHAGLALRNASLLDQVTRQAATDGLTGVANRRTFESTMEYEARRAARSHEPLSLVMVDIDHFKKVNDTHGHQIGDEVIREVAKILEATSREFDVVARYGGEEFGVILPACPAADAVAVAERMRHAVATATTAVPVTVSLGVATFPTDAASPDALIATADQALYASKRAGRNRVTAGSAAGDAAPVEVL